jgi:hypothetical protein
MPAKGVDSHVLTGEALLARFTALDAFLTQHQALWKPRPFTHLQLPWETAYPELATWLRGRSLEDAENAHNQPALLDAPSLLPHWRRCRLSWLQWVSCRHMRWKLQAID